jgi:glycosyltransferase involved in cell wall biosynthesis
LDVWGVRQGSSRSARWESLTWHSTFLSKHGVIMRANLVYLADSPIPSRATNGIQVMRMCGAFSAAGVDVTLVHPYRLGNRPEGFEGDVWSFYGVKSRFHIVTLPTPLTLRLSGVRWLARLLRTPPLALYIVLRSRPGRIPFVSYGRSMLGIWLALSARRLWRRGACRAVFGELHDLPHTNLAQRTVSRLDGVVVISAELERDLLQLCPRLRGRTRVEHDGFDPAVVNSGAMDSGSAKRAIGSDPRAPLVVYTGRVNTEKGARMLVEAALELPNVRFLLVGKVYEGDIVELGRRAGNVSFAGFVAPGRITPFLAAADVLAMPTHPALPYANYTSPLKLFEYMAAGRPVVCSDLPALREVVSDGLNALLFRPGDVDSFVDAVRTVLADPALAKRVALQAQQDVAELSWDARAQRILQWVDDVSAYSPSL